jgi:hypothetical protein
MMMTTTRTLVEVKEKQVSDAVLALLVDEIFTLVEGALDACRLGLGLGHHNLLLVKHNRCVERRVCKKKKKSLEYDSKVKPVK